MIGVCISTTPDRKELFNSTYDRWREFLPDDAVLTFVVDEYGQGVAKTKNECLHMLEILHVTDYFLADNDVWPISKDWYTPYVCSGEPHLMYQFDMPNKPKMKSLHSDGFFNCWDKTRGALLYVNQSVLDKVGGMDTKLINGFEHPNWSDRIHNAGLSTCRAMDVVGSDKLFYCLDQDGKVESSIKKDPVQHRKNYEYYRQNRLSKEYKEYRA